MVTYIHFDLIDAQVFDTMFEHPSEKVREYFMSFINNMASEYQGRSYLLQKEGVVLQLINAMLLDQNDSYFRQNVLGCL